MYVVNNVISKAVTKGVFWVLKHPRNYWQFFYLGNFVYLFSKTFSGCGCSTLVMFKLSTVSVYVRLGMHKNSPF